MSASVSATTSRRDASRKSNGKGASGLSARASRDGSSHSGRKFARERHGVAAGERK
eukprot:CAMPEP_0119394232 /NCGR_PEP_ID=MMETSP1334-20130426/128475_1 /TAXON_ID=127549 /ORGANISM="Calcidiscus leptoporus, Strain RCC1130" /LENGTH=55 /DNA_ID=CAMNT_0007417451 /DNA_START=33 /DNA_END=200 /DNA_ORIENTATION=-